MFITKYKEEDYIEFANNIDTLLPEIYKSSGIVLKEMNDRKLITKELFFNFFLKVQKEEYYGLDKKSFFYSKNKIDNFIWNSLEYFFYENFRSLGHLEEDFYNYAIKNNKIEDICYPILFLRKVTDRGSSPIDDHPYYINFIIKRFKEDEKNTKNISRSRFDYFLLINDRNIETILNTLKENNVIKNLSNNDAFSEAPFGHNSLSFYLNEFPNNGIKLLVGKKLNELSNLDIFLMTTIINTYGFRREEYEKLSFEVYDFFIEYVNTMHGDKTQVYSIKMDMKDLLEIIRRVIKQYREVKVEQEENSDVNNLLVMHMVKKKLEHILRYDVLKNNRNVNNIESLIKNSAFESEIYHLFREINEMEMFMYLWKEASFIKNSKKEDIKQARLSLENSFANVLKNNHNCLQNQADFNRDLHLIHKDKQVYQLKNILKNNETLQIRDLPENILKDIDNLNIFNVPLIKEAFVLYYKDFHHQKSSISEDSLKKFFRLSMVLNIPILLREIHNEFMLYSGSPYIMKSHFLIDLYERNINNISFFWQSVVWKDVENINLIENWLENNFHRISNVDLEAIYLKINDTDRNIFLKEIFRRKKNNIVIDKVYELSFNQQKMVYLQNCFGNTDTDEVLHCFMLIDPENLKKFTASEHFNREVKELFVADEMVGEHFKEFLKIIENMKKDDLILLEKFDEVNYQNKKHMIFMENHEEEELRNISKIYHKVWVGLNNESDLQLFNHFKCLIEKDGLDSVLEEHYEEIGEILYLLKKSSSELVNISEDIFWKKYMFYSLFKNSEMERLEVKKYELRHFAKVCAYKEYLIPQNIRADKLIHTSLNTVKDREKRFNGDKLFDLLKIDEVFLLAREQGLIGEKEKYIIQNENWENLNLDEVEKIFDKKVDHIIINDLSWNDNYNSGEALFNQLNRILKNAWNNIVNLENIFKIFFEYEKQPYFPSEEEEESLNFSKEQKVKILQHLFLTKNYYINNTGNYLTIFSKIFKSLGGRKGIEEYIADKNVLMIFDEKDIAMLYFVYSKILLDDGNRDAIKYFNNLEELHGKTRLFANERGHWFNENLSTIFKDEKFNIGSLIREMNLLEELNKVKKDSGVVVKKKI